MAATFSNISHETWTKINLLYNCIDYHDLIIKKPKKTNKNDLF